MHKSQSHRDARSSDLNNIGLPGAEITFSFISACLANIFSLNLVTLEEQPVFFVLRSPPDMHFLIVDNTTSLLRSFSFRELWYTAPITISSSFSLRMYTTACWMLDLTSTVVQPCIKVGPKMLDFLYQGFLHMNSVGYFVSQMRAMWMSRLCKSCYRRILSLRMPFESWQKNTH